MIWKVLVVILVITNIVFGYCLLIINNHTESLYVESKGHHKKSSTQQYEIDIITEKVFN